MVCDVGKLEEAFDFAYDWDVLHHIFPEDRVGYVDTVRRVLRPEGTYLSVCFSEDDMTCVVLRVEEILGGEEA